MALPGWGVSRIKPSTNRITFAPTVQNFICGSSLPLPQALREPKLASCCINDLQGDLLGRWGSHSPLPGSTCGMDSPDRKSTRPELQSRQYLVCRLLLA